MTADATVGRAHLTLAGVAAGYGPMPVVRGVDLTVEEGAAVAVLGPNGAGKTALLRTVAGLARSLAGTILLGGVDVSAMDATRIARHGLRLVPSDRRLFDDLSVMSHLRVAAEQARRDRREPSGRGYDPRRAIDEVLEVFPRLAERRRQAAGTMSGGEQQMLALARALVAEPSLLLLDEPSAGLAPRIIDDLYRALAAWRAVHGGTLVVAEQQPSRVRGTTSWAIVLVAGELVVAGPTDEVARDDRLWRIYQGLRPGDAPPEATP